MIARKKTISNNLKIESNNDINEDDEDDDDEHTSNNYFFNYKFLLFLDISNNIQSPNNVLVC